MLDFHDFLNLIKEIAVKAVKAENPTLIVFGTVTSVSPLKINIEQKMTLSSSQLVLTRSVTNHRINNDTVSESGLSTGDEVLLVRMQGGQKYVVLDRVVSL